MTDKTFSDELERALARPDANKLVHQIDVYIEYDRSGARDWPDDIADDLGEVLGSGFDDPDKALAYVMIAAARTDDPEFLGFMGASILEDTLVNPPPEFIERVVEEARNSARFRWMLGVPYSHVIAERVWERIEVFAVEDIDNTPLPPRLSV